MVVQLTHAASRNKNFTNHIDKEMCGRNFKRTMFLAMNCPLNWQRASLRADSYSSEFYKRSCKKFGTDNLSYVKKPWQIAIRQMQLLRHHIYNY